MDLMSQPATVTIARLRGTLRSFATAVGQFWQGYWDSPIGC